MDIKFLKKKSKSIENPFGYFVIKGKKAREGATRYLVISEDWVGWPIDGDGKPYEMYIGGCGITKEDHLVVDRNSEELMHAIKEYAKDQLTEVYNKLYNSHGRAYFVYQLETIQNICNLLRKHDISVHQLWRELKG